MASSSAMLKLCCLGLLGLLILAPHAEAAISCGQVTGSLGPCVGFLLGKRLDPKCCPNIKGLLGQAKTTADRQSICNCLKRSAQSNPNLVGKAGSLLRTCGVSLPYPINPNIDCSKVH